MIRFFYNFGRKENEGYMIVDVRVGWVLVF